ncbi:MAG TPA: penicillin-binding protein 1C, partial [Candidatus Binatia bacterium]|nr:penicillin-binding protein 1C [Candidatus Binatia bacterium]
MAWLLAHRSWRGGRRIAGNGGGRTFGDIGPRGSGRIDAQLATCLTAAAVLCTTIGAGALWRLARTDPAGLASYAQTRAAHCPSDLRLLDRNGQIMHELRLDQRRRRLRWTPLPDISPALQSAVLTTEDRRFYDHHGVDMRALAAAAWQRIFEGSARGASTITMQLVALLDDGFARGPAPRSIASKWRQMRAAWALEARWSKAQILEAYLNMVTFRGELQGAAAASAVLFDKAPHGIGGGEAAILAALLRSPNATRAEAERRVRKQNPDIRDLTPFLDDAFDSPSGSGPRIAGAPHAARMLLTRDDLDACADRASSLDAEVQRVAAESLHRHLLELRGRSAGDGAVLVADNASGEVLAYVASSGELSSSPHVDGIRALRQPGSTLKPFLYALALDKRLVTAATLLEDTPAEIAVGEGIFRPRNYDRLFRGLVPVRAALAGSLNVPAVRTLGLVGTDRFADFLRSLGMDAIDRDGDFYGPSLALGSAEVSLWQLVGAYRTLAQRGLYRPLRMSAGDRAEAARVIGEEAAFVIADILADRGSRAGTFELENALTTRFWSAAKTGTSKDMRDNWCIGFSDRYTVGVWVGNFAGAPMRDVSGVSGAAPVWNEVMSYLHRGNAGVAPSPPPALVRARHDPSAPEEWFLRGTEPSAPSRIAAQPRILTPTDGSIVTVDLDTPHERRRLTFMAEA